MQQQGGKPERAKFVLYFTTFDKAMVLNATNKNVLVDDLGRNPGRLDQTPRSVCSQSPRSSAASRSRGCALGR